MHISLKSEMVGHVFGLPITNSLVLSFATVALVGILSYVIARFYKSVPQKLQSVGEVIVEGILDFMDGIMASREQSVRFFPFIAALFLFILFNNWIGLLPGIGSFGFYHMEEGHRTLVPFFRSANSDLNSTLALALISVLMVQYYGFRQAGFWGHLAKYFPIKQGPIQLFVGILELVEEFAKVFSFSFRLFGNVFAGEVLLLITMNLMPMFLPLPFVFLEIFVGFVQALVFTILTLIFLKVTVETVHH